MSYNRNYNTRNSGRYNTPGQFVPAGQPPTQQPPLPQPPLPPPALASRAQAGPAANRFDNSQQNFEQQPPNSYTQLYESTNDHSDSMNDSMQDDFDMKPSMAVDTSQDSDGSSQPPWKKKKLGATALKKISNKERRRRQNRSMRRLVTPKNALMVLNELMPGEQFANHFKVGPTPSPNYYNGKPAFCAELTINGTTYKGFGENKLVARNDAAEQVIRDILIKKMAECPMPDPNAPYSAAEEGHEGELEPLGDPTTLPMIQLVSFALHKLFTEWETNGHRVPSLRGGGVPEVKPPPPAKPLPPHASAMHPCMLLTHMRPHLEYRELRVEGDKPQNMQYTIGVEVDGQEFVGKAGNKKEARRSAARAACEKLFGVTFVPPTATTN